MPDSEKSCRRGHVQVGVAVLAKKQYRLDCIPSWINSLLRIAAGYENKASTNLDWNMAPDGIFDVSFLCERGECNGGPVKLKHKRSGPEYNFVVSYHHHELLWPADVFQSFAAVDEHSIRDSRKRSDAGDQHHQFASIGPRFLSAGAST